MINGGLILNLDNDSLYNRIFAEKLQKKIIMKIMKIKIYLKKIVFQIGLDSGE